MLFERRQHWDKVGDEADEWQPLWARTGEKACRLALIYAASRGIENLRIDTLAVEWACEVADYTTRLFQSRGNDCIADTEFEGQCQRTLRAIAGKKRRALTFANSACIVAGEDLSGHSEWKSSQCCMIAAT